MGEGKGHEMEKGEEWKKSLRVWEKKNTKGLKRQRERNAGCFTDTSK